MATLDDIARELGVSKSTVSKALNGAKDVSKAMRHTVLEKAVELGSKIALVTTNTTTDENGRLTIEELLPGQYVLEETKAPAGYDLSKGELVLSNYRLNPVTHNSFVTRPYEARVYYFK